MLHVERLEARDLLTGAAGGVPVSTDHTALIGMTIPADPARGSAPLDAPSSTAAGGLGAAGLEAILLATAQSNLAVADGADTAAAGEALAADALPADVSTAISPANGKTAAVPLRRPPRSLIEDDPAAQHRLLMLVPAPLNVLQVPPPGLGPAGGSVQPAGAWTSALALDVAGYATVDALQATAAGLAGALPVEAAPNDPSVATSVEPQPAAPPGSTTAPALTAPCQPWLAGLLRPIQRLAVEPPPASSPAAVASLHGMALLAPASFVCSAGLTGGACALLVLQLSGRRLQRTLRRSLRRRLPALHLTEIGGPPELD